MDPDPDSDPDPGGPKYVDPEPDSDPDPEHCRKDILVRDRLYFWSKIVAGIQEIPRFPSFL